MTKETIIQEERSSLTKRAIQLKNSINDENPDKLLSFVNTIEHILKVKLKKVEYEITTKKTTNIIQSSELIITPMDNNDKE